MHACLIHQSTLFLVPSSMSMMVHLRWKIKRSIAFGRSVKCAMNASTQPVEPPEKHLLKCLRYTQKPKWLSHPRTKTKGSLETRLWTPDRFLRSKSTCLSIVLYRLSEWAVLVPLSRSRRLRACRTLFARRRRREPSPMHTGQKWTTILASSPRR